ncbi:MAG: hypothetical protein AAFN74_22195 [Myxococcota bacterium]
MIDDSMIDDSPVRRFKDTIGFRRFTSPPLSVRPTAALSGLLRATHSIVEL